MLMKIKLKVLRRRLLIRAQAKVRLTSGIQTLRKKQRWLEIMKSAAGICAGLHQMSSTRVFFNLHVNFVYALQPHLRMIRSRERFMRFKQATTRIQTYSRMWAFKRTMKKKKTSVEKIQHFGRYHFVRKWYSRFSRAGKIITRFFYNVFTQIRFEQWIEDVRTACLDSDVKKLTTLLEVQKPYNCLSHIPIFMLSNMKDKTYQSSFMHQCAKSGSLECAQVLVKCKCRVGTRDSLGNTPLHIACSRGDLSLKVLKFILHNTARPSKLLSTSNHEGLYPCDMILDCEDARHDMTTMLLELGADASENTLLTLERELEAREISKKIFAHQMDILNKKREDEEKKDVDFGHVLLAMSDTFFLKQEFMKQHDDRDTKMSSSVSSKVQDRVVENVQKAKQIRAVLKIQAHVRRMLMNIQMRKKMKPIMISHVDPKQWKSNYTATGKKYYFNVKTGHTTWDKVGRRRASSITAFLAKHQQKADIALVEKEAFRIAQKNQGMQSEIEKLKEKLQRLQNKKSIEQRISSTLLEQKKKESMKSHDLKRRLLRALLFMQDPHNSHWYFVDGAQKRHGPYSEAQMVAWRKHFHPRQHISKARNGPFTSMQDAFGQGKDQPDFIIGVEDLKNARRALSDLDS